MALAQLKVEGKETHHPRAQLGKKFKTMCNRIIPGARYVGRGLMAVWRLMKAKDQRVMSAVKEMLQRGYILLPSGGTAT